MRFPALFCLAAVLTGACAQESVPTAPAPVSASCTIAVPENQRTQVIGAAGGGLGILVSASPGCAWSATSQAEFLQIAAGGTGTGEESVLLNVARNPGSERTGTVAIGTNTVTVIQKEAAAGDTCRFQLNPTSATVGSAGGQTTVAVMADPASCAWTSSATDTFVQITGGSAGTGSGSVVLALASNSGDARQSNVTIAGLNFVLAQHAHVQPSTPACIADISPRSLLAAAAGGAHTVSVAAVASCNWTVAVNGDFIKLSTPPSGAGSQTVSFVLAANPTTSPRSGALVLGGSHTLPITQLGISPPPPIPSAPTFLSFVSELQDYVGGGLTRVETHPQARFVAGIDASLRTLQVDITSADGTPWTLRLAAPNGQELRPGVYEQAERALFAAGGRPGLDFSGDGRGCNQVSGRFVVTEATYGPGNSVDRFRASFEQHCEHNTPALLGEVSLTAPFGVAPPPPAPAPPPFAPGTYLTFDSPFTEYIGQGQSLAFTEATAAFQISAPSDLREVAVDIRPLDGSPQWSLRIAAPAGNSLVPGHYQGAMKWPFQLVTRPGFDFSGDGRSCSILGAEFDVHESAFSAGVIQRFRVTFYQACLGSGLGIRGDLQIVGP